MSDDAGYSIAAALLLCAMMPMCNRQPTAPDYSDELRSVAHAIDEFGS